MEKIVSRHQIRTLDEGVWYSIITKSDITAPVHSQSDRDELQSLATLSVLRLVFPYPALFTLVYNPAPNCQAVDIGCD